MLLSFCKARYFDSIKVLKGDTDMYNPYQQFNPFIQQQNTLPQQQIVQVNGKASVDTIQLAPNSSILVMDTSAPIVWMCVSDGVGKVTATPYDISVHKEKQTSEYENIEQRIAVIEKAIVEMEDKINAKSNVGRIKQKSGITDDATD